MKTHVVLKTSPREEVRFRSSSTDHVHEFVIGDKSTQQSIQEFCLTQLEDQGLVPTTLAQDLFNLSMAVFAADKRTSRKQTMDGWTRDIVLHVPVSHASLWRSATAHVVDCLSFLTGDSWAVHFRTRTGIPRGLQGELAFEAPPAVCLFSGGLDSFIGAIDLIAQHKKVMLVGHYDHGSVSGPQKSAARVLQSKYGKRVAPLSFRVELPRDGRTVERTTRGRSFLFIALGVLVASAYQQPPALVIPENGLIALNVPLTGPRSGSLSTRTTHPYYIAAYQKLLNALGLNVTLELPYRMLTKGEMLRGCMDQQLLRDRFRSTMSCAHPGVGRYDKKSAKDHCGYCLPCIIRRASLVAAGMAQREKYFIRDLKRTPPSPLLKRDEDLRAIRMAVVRSQNLNEAQALFEVLASGPIPVANERLEYARVYMRGLKELSALF